MSASSMFDSCFTHQFKLNFSETKKLAIGHSISSEDIFAGGHLWRIICYPRGGWREDNGEYVSIYLKHVSESKDAKAIFEAFVVDKGGKPSLSHRNRLFVHAFAPKDSGSDSDGWPRFIKRSVLESLYSTTTTTGGSSFVIITCGVRVVRQDPLDAPPSDIGSHLGLLLDCAEGADVSFAVDGVKFLAHRAVIAARSPVLKAELQGPNMVEAEMSSITLHDIAPATFKVMLRFLYTDASPAANEIGDDPDDMFRRLLAAADRFALDRLKILCAGKLWDNISVDTVAATLICAETYNCPQLKKKCIDFIAEEKNFKKAVLSFVQLAQQFPSILDDMREKVGV